MPAMQAETAADCAAIGEIDTMDTVLEVLARTTGLRISMVVKVTDDEWTACAVRDEADYGLEVGDQLDVATTY